LKGIKTIAEQLTQGQRWTLILRAAFRQFLGERSSEALVGSPMPPANCSAPLGLTSGEVCAQGIAEEVWIVSACLVHSGTTILAFYN
jgi:hypothetical protein